METLPKGGTKVKKALLPAKYRVLRELNREAERGPEDYNGVCRKLAGFSGSLFVCLRSRVCLITRHIFTPTIRKMGGLQFRPGRTDCRLLAEEAKAVGRGVGGVASSRSRSRLDGTTGGA